MIKHLLATTALVAIATSAFAANPADAPKPAAMNASQQNATYMPSVTAGDMLATKLIGQTVYTAVPLTSGAAVKPTTDAAAKQQAQNDQTKNGQKNGQAPANQMQNANAQSIGDINDLVVAENGGVDAVVIGVGGFLGMGEKNVAVPFDQLSWTKDGNGKAYVTLATTKEELQNAPAFDVSALQNGPTGTDKQAQNQAPTAAPMPANGGTKSPNTVAVNPPVAKTAPAAGAATDNNKQPATVDVAKISADELINTTVYDTDNQNVGEVGDVIANKDGTIDAIVVDVGGFLGIGQKPVAIAFEDLDIRKDQNNKLVLHTAFTKEQLDNAPQYDKNAYPQQRDQMRLHTQQG